MVAWVVAAISLCYFGQKQGEREHLTEFCGDGTLYHWLDKVGICPRCILDIGANRGDWTREWLTRYPNSNFIMFEGNPEHKDEWGDLLVRPNVIGHAGVILSNKETEVKWFKHPGTGTGDSLLKEQTSVYNGVSGERRKSFRLDDIMQRHHPNCKADYIKLDVQGAELMVLNGGLRTLRSSRALQAELSFFSEYNKGAPTFAQAIAYFDLAGFIPIEIIEQHEIDGFIQQIDVLFVRKSYMHQVRRVNYPDTS